MGIGRGFGVRMGRRLGGGEWIEDFEDVKGVEGSEDENDLTDFGCTGVHL